MNNIKYPSKAVITVGKPDGHKEIHIGHLSGGLITSDIFARFLRNRIGFKNVLFVTGTECYGTAVYEDYLKNKKENESIEEYIYYNHLKQKEMLREFQISLNDYYCDSSDIELHTIHGKLCQEFIRYLVKNNNVLNKSENILVDPETDLFLNYRQIQFTGRQKSNIKRKKYNVEDISEMISTISDKRPIIKEVDNYFLDLSKRRQAIIELHRDKYPEMEKYLKHIFPVNNLDENKKDFNTIRLTCNSNLGMNVTIDNKSKKLWNWIDSLIAPISYTMCYNLKNEKDIKDWRTWWCEKDSEIYHFMAQDNVFFYMVIEPYLIQAWNDINKDKINYPYYVLTPMRTIFNGKYTGPFPTGNLLLKNYSAEAIRYSIASMGNGNSSFNPEKLIDESLEMDNIDFKYNAILKKVKRLSSMAKNEMKDIPKTIYVPQESVEQGKNIFEKYEEIMFNKDFGKAIDLIEEKFKFFLNDKDNVFYNTKLALVMLYPFLPKVVEEKYMEIYDDFDLYENYNSENQKIDVISLSKEHKETEEYSR